MKQRRSVLRRRKESGEGGRDAGDRAESRRDEDQIERSPPRRPVKSAARKPGKKSAPWRRKACEGREGHRATSLKAPSEKSAARATRARTPVKARRKAVARPLKTTAKKSAAKRKVLAKAFAPKAKAAAKAKAAPKTAAAPTLYQVSVLAPDHDRARTVAALWGEVAEPARVAVSVFEKANEGFWSRRSMTSGRTRRMSQRA